MNAPTRVNHVCASVIDSSSPDARRTKAEGPTSTKWRASHHTSRICLG